MKYYLIDNQRYSLLQFFQDNYQQYDSLYIATGYLDLLALHEILPLIASYKKIEILIGQEPLIKRYNKTDIELNFPKLDFNNDLQELPIDGKYATTIDLIRSMINDNKLEIKIYKKTFLHAKCYIFAKHDHVNEKIERAVGIIGSSNLTYHGISHNNNVELNHIEHNEMIVKYPATKDEPHLIGHYAWFQELWNNEDSINWSGEFTELLDSSAHGELMFTQYEMYIKTLWDIYQEEIEVTGSQESTGYKLFEYQLKNANSVCRKLKKHKLALLCDSVGLGKTITAIEVITRYKQNITNARVVIICPKSLQEQWQRKLDQHKLPVPVISLQNVELIEQQMESDRDWSVSLFVIDESHNLRTGSSSARYELIRNWIKKNQSAHRLLLTATPINNSIIDLLNQILLASGGDANVITSQINGKGSRNIVEIFQSIRKSEGQIKKITSEILTKRREALYPIIKELVVRRTRQGILKEQELSNFQPKLQFPKEQIYTRSYDFTENLSSKIIKDTTNNFELLSSDLKIQNFGQIINKIYLIPELCEEYNENNEKISLTIDDMLIMLKHPIHQLDQFKQFYSAEEIKSKSPLRLVYQVIQFLGFIPYRYMIYHSAFYGKKINEIKNMPQTLEHQILNRQKGLFGILRTVFLKRLESSYYALSVSLNNYKKTLEMFEQAVINNIVMPLSALKDFVVECDEDNNVDNIIYNFDDIKQLDESFNINDFNKKQMLDDIKLELELLNILKIQIEFLRNDNNKIKELAQLFTEINHQYKHYNNRKPKILVFSYFADTIKHLEDEFHNYFAYNSRECAFLTAKNRAILENCVKRFTPKSKDYIFKAGENEIQYLFATDVLSEGQNLQDCAVIVNYDLHWNPVRMIQRNGRINRIGSEYSEVLIFNMHPHSQLEEYLKLVQKLEYKINLIKDIIGQDQKILSATEELNPIEFTDEIDSEAVNERDIDIMQNLYSQDQDIREKAYNSLENEDEYLTADKFITDLRYFDAKYKDNQDYKNSIYSIPKGKFGLLPNKNTANKTDQRLLIFSEVLDQENNRLKYLFFERVNGKPNSIDELQALELIRVNDTNEKRCRSQRYKLYLPYFKEECMQEFLNIIQPPEHGRVLNTAETNLRKKFLTLLKNYHYDEESFNIFDQAIYYGNHSDVEQIIKNVKNILKAPSHKIIEEVLNICKKAVNNNNNTNQQETFYPVACKGVLYYGN
jgi:superfamily II DNA or RNA helicase